jgi:hypothetical protein
LTSTAERTRRFGARWTNSGPSAFARPGSNHQRCSRSLYRTERQDL